MPKPVKLTLERAEASTAPPAAGSTRSAQDGRETTEPILPLQLRLPRGEIRRIKIAAATREQTISQFVVTCVTGTVWGTAPWPNLQVERGAALAPKA